MTSQELIQRLSEFSLRKKMTQEQLAHEVGVTFCTINNWFNGKHQKMHKATEKVVLQYLASQGELK